jgi:hypothetical protein
MLFHLRHNSLLVDNTLFGAGSLPHRTPIRLKTNVLPLFALCTWGLKFVSVFLKDLYKFVALAARELVKNE